MSREWLIETCEEVEKLTTAEDFFFHIQQFTQKLGYEKFLFSSIPTYALSEPENLPNFLSQTPHVLMNWDMEWADYYMDKAYYGVDPAFEQALAGGKDAYIWHTEYQNFSNPQKRMRNESIEAGLTNGYSLPLQNSFGSISGIGLSIDASVREFELLYQETSQFIETYAYIFISGNFRKAQLNLWRTFCA